MIAVALVLFVVADIVYLYRNAAGSYEVGGPLDACWSFAAAPWASPPGRPTSGIEA